jgi:hypothetical protein
MAQNLSGKTEVFKIISPRYIIQPMKNVTLRLFPTSVFKSLAGLTPEQIAL